MSGFTQEMLRVFADATGSATHMVKGDAPINFAGFNSYIVGDMAARKLSTFGGEKWDIPYQAAEGNHLKQVNPGAVRSLTRTDDVERMSQLGVLFYQDLALIDREVEANEGLMSLAAAGAWSMFYDRVYSVKKTKHQQAAITAINDMERMAAAVGNFNTMENRSNKPTEVTSLTSIINEWYLSCFGITTATGFTAGSAGVDYNTAAVAAGGRWTTKQGVTVNQTKNVVNGRNIFSCQQESYTTIDTATTSFINAMLRAQTKAAFAKPPSFPNLMPSGIESKSETTAKCWYTSLKGLDVMQAVTVTTQDLWPAPSRVDPAVNGPSMRGIPLEWWPMLDTYAGYPGGTNTTLVTEGAATGDRKGPRFLLHDRDAITVVAHRLNWFRKRIAAGEALIPDRMGEYLDVEYNLGATDFRTSACVYPSATIAALGTY